MFVFRWAQALRTDLLVYLTRPIYVFGAFAAYLSTLVALAGATFAVHYVPRAEVEAAMLNTNPHVHKLLVDAALVVCLDVSAAN